MSSASELNWINLPWCDISRVLSKLRAESASAYLVVPDWPTQPWWPDLRLKMSTAMLKVEPQPDNFFPGKGGSAEPNKSPFWITLICKIK